MVQYKVKRRPKSMRKKANRHHHTASGSAMKHQAADWNDRFHVTTSNNNNQLHQYFREYFDKKPK